MKIFQAPIYTKAQLYMLDEKDIVYPFSDEDAIYLGLNHQYELTRGYFEERGYNLETYFKTPDEINRFLKEVRIKTYNYVYSNSKSSRNQINYLIAKRGILGFGKYEYRQEFLEAMFLMGEYLLINGDVSKVSGVDLDTMQNMSIDVIRHQDRDISKDARNKLIQLGLNYYGRYRFIPQGNDW